MLSGCPLALSGATVPVKCHPCWAPGTRAVPTLRPTGGGCRSPFPCGANRAMRHRAQIPFFIPRESDSSHLLYVKLPSWQ